MFQKIKSLKTTWRYFGHIMAIYNNLNYISNTIEILREPKQGHSLQIRKLKNNTEYQNEVNERKHLLREINSL